MARGDEQKRKLELLDQLSRQRAQITSQRSRVATQIANKKVELKEKINVSKRVKDTVRSSFSSSPTRWFVGSAVGGLFVSRILFGKRSPRRERRSSSSSSSSSKESKGIVKSSLLYFAKPYIKSFLFNKGREMLLRKMMSKQIAEQQQYEAEHQQQY